MARVAVLKARGEKYTDRKTGQEKQSYTICGSVFERQDGSRMYKLESIPVNFDGWLFEAEPPEQQARDAAGGNRGMSGSNRGRSMQSNGPHESNFDTGGDDIPF